MDTNHTCQMSNFFRSTFNRSVNCDGHISISAMFRHILMVAGSVAKIIPLVLF